MQEDEEEEMLAMAEKTAEMNSPRQVQRKGK